MVNSQMETRNRSKVLIELKSAQEKGLLSGICGRLGDLGIIDMYYDQAFSNACPALDFIVVDSVKDAEQAISFLKDNNVGVANFIPLDKMGKFYE